MAKSKDKSTITLSRYKITNPETLKWRNFEVNVDRLLDSWEVEIRDLYIFLDKMEPHQLVRLATALGVNTSVNSGKLPLIKASPRYCFEILAHQYFVDLNQKEIAHQLGLKQKNGLFDQEELVIRLLEQSKAGGLTKLFLNALQIRLGKGNFKFDLYEIPTAAQVQNLMTKAKSMSRALGRTNKTEYRYQMRYAVPTSDAAYILVLRETADKIIPSIPNNKHAVTAKYILCYLNFNKKTCTITTGSKREAYTIRSYLYKKLEVAVYSKINEVKIVAADFYEKLLQKNQDDGLTFNGFTLRQSVGATKISVKGAHSPDGITDQAVILKNANIMASKRLSELESIIYHYKGLDYYVSIYPDNWGGLWMRLNTTSKPREDLEQFLNKFRARFAVNLPCRVDGEESDLSIARKILGQQKLQLPLPAQVQKIFLNFVSDKLIQAPTKASKRKCTKCQKVSWTEEQCPICAGDMFILGEYLSVQFNRANCEKYVFKSIKDNLAVSGKFSRRQRTIDKNVHTFLVLERTDEPDIWFYMSLGESVRNVEELFEYTGNPLIFIFMKHGDNLIPSLISKGFHCIDVVDLSYDKDIWDDLKKATKDITRDISIKRKKAAEASFKRLNNKPRSYDDQDFEQDIFNLIHEVFGIADRLGGKFSGVKAPDGVAAINTRSGKNSKKLSVAWDCKYSVSAKGYQLNDKPLKHRFYLKALANNKEFKKFGHFKSYLIISQNMDQTKYQSFYTKLTKNFVSWKGVILYINEGAIVELYSIYKSFYEQIESNPAVFYTLLSKSISKVLKRDSAPFPHFSEQLLESLITKLKTGYKKTQKRISLKRDDFI